MIGPGDQVRLRVNPRKTGVVINSPSFYDDSVPQHRKRILVSFPSGNEEILLASLELLPEKAETIDEKFSKNKFGELSDLRGCLTQKRLSGKISNLIYSLNSTDTEFKPYQYFPLLKYIDSPNKGILIADEVGLGKTIEAGLIWTELKIREDTKRLLVICPSFLTLKWQDELSKRFGIKASINNAKELLQLIKSVDNDPSQEFAVISSYDSLKPSRNWKNSVENKLDKLGNPRSELSNLFDDHRSDHYIFDLVIFDEAHYLKNKESQRFKLANLLKNVSMGRVLLSATPIQLGSQDLFNLMSIVDEDQFLNMEHLDRIIKANEPVNKLRDNILANQIKREEILENLTQISQSIYYKNSKVLQSLIERTSNEDYDVSSPRQRSHVADQIDRLNPLSKCLNRTRKIDVIEDRTIREAVVQLVSMSEAETVLYEEVTNRIRQFCIDQEISSGFMLSGPQRQISSSMISAYNYWQSKNKLSNTNNFHEDEYHEIFDEEVDESFVQRKTGPLTDELLDLVTGLNLGNSLLKNDSKFNKLKNDLINFFKKSKENKKILLFAYFRATLEYLYRQLNKTKIKVFLIHGSSKENRYQTLKDFEDYDGQAILLASEVASEGIDLQFCGIVINYDLPWNPAKIEQRIGRIDRIGQKLDKILIWNYIYEDTIDERIYDRLLHRLNIFERTLGGAENILGKQIRELTDELLSNKLTSEQELERIDKTAIAIENESLHTTQLEENATSLLAHGDYIQRKVEAADEFDRYVTDWDLYTFTKDFFERFYKGTRITRLTDSEYRCSLELSVNAHSEFKQFIDQNQLTSKTRITLNKRTNVIFYNHASAKVKDFEVINHGHPLIKFINKEINNSKAELYFQLAKIRLNSGKYGSLNFKPGVYVYIIHQWLFSGQKDIERLEYSVANIEDAIIIEHDQAEVLINSAIKSGKNYLPSIQKYLLKAYKVFEICRNDLEKKFKDYENAVIEENIDRIQYMINSINSGLQKETSKVSSIVRNLRSSGNKNKLKAIPMHEGKFEKFKGKQELKIQELETKKKLDAKNSIVNSGIIVLED